MVSKLVPKIQTKYHKIILDDFFLNIFPIIQSLNYSVQATAWNQNRKHPLSSEVYLYQSYISGKKICDTRPCYFTDDTRQNLTQFSINLVSQSLNMYWETSKTFLKILSKVPLNNDITNYTLIISVKENWAYYKR